MQKNNKNEGYFVEIGNDLEFFVYIFFDNLNIYLVILHIWFYIE